MMEALGIDTGKATFSNVFCVRGYFALAGYHDLDITYGSV